MTSPASRDTAVITGMRTEVFGDLVASTPDGWGTVVVTGTGAEVCDDTVDSTPDGRGEGEGELKAVGVGVPTMSEYCDPAFAKCPIQLACHRYGQYDFRSHNDSL